jgi:AcrR family transcriptional regulator
MIKGIKFSFSNHLYVKDPQETKYGKRLLSHTVELMAQIGFEAFTFRKLAVEMKSAEASIYRYFENKHQLLVFLSCWYWEWVHYLIHIHTLNIKSPEEQLKLTIHQLLHASEQSNMTEYINENLLHKLLVVEGVKAIHHHDVDDKNSHGMFKSRKELVDKIAQILLEINSQFTYAITLATTMVDMADNQIYYVEHLPKLSSLKNTDDKLNQLERIMNHLAFSSISSPVE